MNATRRTALVAGSFYLITAVALFPVVKRQNEAVALGFVTARVMEVAIIVIGVVCLLAVVTPRRDLAGAPATDAAR